DGKLSRGYAWVGFPKPNTQDVGFAGFEFCGQKFWSMAQLYRKVSRFEVRSCVNPTELADVEVQAPVVRQVVLVADVNEILFGFFSDNIPGAVAETET